MIDRRPTPVEAKVLQRAHELIEKTPNLRFGEAIDRAEEALGAALDTEVKDAMVLALFQLTTNGFPSEVEA